MDEPLLKSEHAAQRRELGAARYKWLLFDMAGCLVCGVLNNVGASMTSFAMYEFPAFLNYWVSFLSAMAMLAVALQSGEPVFATLSPKWRAENPGEAGRLHFIFYLLSWVTAANWIPTEYAAPWVSGNYQQVLTGLSPAFVMLLSWCFLGARFTRTEAASSSIVILGGFIAFVPYWAGWQEDSDTSGHKPWYNSWYFIAVYLCSSVAFALEGVCQERVYKNRPTLGVATTQFWVQLYAIPTYVAASTLEMLPEVTGSTEWHDMSYVLDNQVRAFQCFLGTSGGPMCTSRIPLMWFAWYIVGFAGMYYFNGRLMRQTTAFWTWILSALTNPLSAMMFGIKAIVGPEGYAPFTVWTFAAFVVMLTGIILRGQPEEDEADEAAVEKDLEASEALEAGAGVASKANAFGDAETASLSSASTADAADVLCPDGFDPTRFTATSESSLSVLSEWAWEAASVTSTASTTLEASPAAIRATPVPPAVSGGLPCPTTKHIYAS